MSKGIHMAEEALEKLENTQDTMIDTLDENDEYIASSEDIEDLDSEDSLTFSNGVIEKIVALAVRDVDGVLGMKGGWADRLQQAFGAKDPGKGVSVEVTQDNSVRVNVSIIISYGSYAPQIFEDVKHAVVKEIGGMTGLEVAGVNLRIEDVLTDDEYEATNLAHKKELEKQAREEELEDNE